MYTQTHRTAQRPWQRRLRILFGHAATRPFRRRLRAERPDAVVCTHFLPLELAADVAASPVYGVVTAVDVHALWSSRNVAGYFVASDEGPASSSDAGSHPEQFIPPAFLSAPHSRGHTSLALCAAASGCFPIAPPCCSSPEDSPSDPPSNLLNLWSATCLSVRLLSCSAATNGCAAAWPRPASLDRQSHPRP